MYSICDTCQNIGCVFQSGIPRDKCSFYIAPKLPELTPENTSILREYALHMMKTKEHPDESR